MSDIKNTQINAALSANKSAVSKNMTSLATGRAINSSGDGAAKLAKKTTLLSAIKNSSIAAENMQSASALLKSVESFMGRIEESLLKAKELSLSYENGDGAQIKAMIAQEFNNTVDNINNISTSAKFGDKQVMMADYSHTVEMTSVGKSITSSKITFGERSGPDNTPVELSYDAIARRFTLKVLNGNGKSETLPYDPHKSVYSFGESGVKFTLGSDFNAKTSFNNDPSTAPSVTLKDADDVIGKISNIRIVKFHSSDPSKSLDDILDADAYKNFVVTGKANNATIKIGESLTVSNIDFSEGAYTDRRITLQSTDGKQKMIVEYDWSLTDVQRLHTASDITTDPADVTIGSLDYTVDFVRKADDGISIAFQSGITGGGSDKIIINYPSIDTYNLGLTDIDLANDQSSVVAKLDSASAQMAEQRAKIGMTIKSVEATKETLESTIDQYNNTLDAIDSIDVASTTTDLAIAKAQVEMTISLIGQLNEQASEYNNLVR